MVQKPIKKAATKKKAAANKHGRGDRVTLKGGLACGSIARNVCVLATMHQWRLDERFTQAGKRMKPAKGTGRAEHRQLTKVINAKNEARAVQVRSNAA